MKSDQFLLFTHTCPQEPKKFLKMRVQQKTSYQTETHRPGHTALVIRFSYSPMHGLQNVGGFDQ